MNVSNEIRIDDTAMDLRRYESLATLRKQEVEIMYQRMHFLQTEHDKLAGSRGVQIILKLFQLRQRLKNILKRQKNQDSALNENSDCADSMESSEKKTAKKRILLVVDVRNWAYDNIVKQIIKHNSDKYEFGTIYLRDLLHHHSVFLLAKDYDLIHFMWRGILALTNEDSVRDYANLLGMEPLTFYNTYVRNKLITTSVYDHLFLEEDFKHTAAMFSADDPLMKAYGVSSQILYDIYLQDDRINFKPSRLITDGVNLELFRPINPERFSNRSDDKPFVVGWAGNSEWMSEQEDFKGLHSIIIPAITQMQQEGKNIQLHLCDKNIKQIPHEEMPTFYSEIDCYLCMSKCEGTPNPILESMACGVPFVSTHVGIVPEVAGKLQSEFILKERTSEELKEKLCRLMESPDLLKKLSDENLVSIQNWNWEDRAKEFGYMWDDVFEKYGNIK